MHKETFPKSLQAPTLMKHMQVLCKEIGPRPSASVQEHQAAGYVTSTLGKLGWTDIQEQVFTSKTTVGWMLIPTTLAAALAVPLARLGGRWGKLAGGLLLLGSTYTFQGVSTARTPVFERLVPHKASQNVIARIAPAGPAKRHIYLIAHLDTQKQRFLSPPPDPRMMKAQVTFPVIAGTLAGLWFIIEALLNRRRISWWQWALGAFYLLMLPSEFNDEAQPHVEGANDNASAVGILLGIAEALQQHPLHNTEITLLFTGCEEAMCIGMENYLEKFAPPKENTFWIDLEMVGTGNLCYVTKHSIDYLEAYYPHPKMVELAKQTAREHIELGLVGKDMLIVEEVANLRHRDYQAICIAGYNDKGFLPNWHRLSDTLENIEPDTLSRAARYTWALMQAIDGLPT